MDRYFKTQPCPFFVYRSIPLGIKPSSPLFYRLRVGFIIQLSVVWIEKFTLYLKNIQNQLRVSTCLVVSRTNSTKIEPKVSCSLDRHFYLLGHEK